MLDNRLKDEQQEVARLGLLVKSQERAVENLKAKGEQGRER